MQLRGSKIVLRDFASPDVDAVWAVIGDDRVTRTLSFDSRDRGAAQTMVENAAGASRGDSPTEYYLAVATLNQSAVVGIARLALGSASTAKIGLAIAAAHWGQGYGSDAVATFVEFGFGQRGLHRITAAIAPGNDCSIRLFERHGFSYEGRLREHVFTAGAWRDSLLYSLLASEWRDGIAH